MYQRSALPYGLASCRSMNIAAPASSAPGPSSSLGIRRATAASMKADSALLKKVYPLEVCALAAEGAAASPSCHGISPVMVLPPAGARALSALTAADAIGKITPAVRKRRRVTFGCAPWPG